MSAKSRKRNRRLAALAGVITAGALAARKNKADLASTEDGKGGIDTTQKAKQSMTSDKAYSPPKKKDTAKKTDYKDSIMSGGSGVKYSKSTPVKKARITLGVGDGGPLKLKDNSIRARDRETNAAGIKEPNKSMAATIFPRSKSADNYAGDMRDFQKTNYKSGGRVKGCGKALRGYGKAMKGKR